MPFLIFIAIAAIAIILSSNATKTAREKWHETARQLGLVFHPDGGSRVGTMSGRVRGHTTAISTFSRGSGNSRKTYTKYLLTYKTRIPVDFKMVKQGLRHSVGKVFGLQDIEIGNPAFDDLILLQANRPADAIRFLTPGMQKTVRSMAVSYPDFVITNSSIEINRRGTDSDPVLITKTVHRIAAFCDLMSEHAAPKSYSEPIKPPGVPEPDWVVVPAEEPDPEPTADEPQQPAPPAPPPEPAAETAEPAAEIEPKPDIAETDLPEVFDLKELAAELSGGTASQCLTAGKRFEEQYKGQCVTGSGILQRVNKFNYDPVFKNSQGTKATFVICELDGPYSKVAVTAEVKYSAEEYEVLQSKIDTELPIAGTLIAQNAMTNQYYIES